MADLLKTGSDWLMAKLTSECGFGVSYRRGSEAVSVTATLGSTTFEQDSNTGGIIQWESRDYLIDAADLLLSGKSAEPQRGDLIEETRGGSKYTYEVIGERDLPPWRWSDPYRTKYRIHTKLYRQPA